MRTSGGMSELKLRTSIGRARLCAVMNTLAAELERVRDDRDVLAYPDLERILPHAEKVALAHGFASERSIDMLGDLGRQHRR